MSACVCVCVQISSTKLFLFVYINCDRHRAILFFLLSFFFVEWFFSLLFWTRTQADKDGWCIHSEQGMLRCHNNQPFGKDSRDVNSRLGSHIGSGQRHWHKQASTLHIVHECVFFPTDISYFTVLWRIIFAFCVCFFVTLASFISIDRKKNI